MKKIDFGRQFVTQHLTLFQCPLCQQPFSQVVKDSLICPNGHTFDLSKKGTLYFLTKRANNEYDHDMLASRQRLLQAGLFDDIIAKIESYLDDKPETILDVGCGEGTPLARLLERRQVRDIAVGFDISKDGINLATQYGSTAFFCVADLARLPFNQETFSTVIDLFSPSAYHEFNRVIRPGGKLIKIVPNAGYLKELRQLLYGDDQRNSQYSNQQVVELYLKHYPKAEVQTLRRQFKIPAGLQQDLLIMTPLHWGQNKRSGFEEDLQQLKEITIDVSFLVNKF